MENGKRDKVTVYTNGKNIINTDVKDADGKHILRVQEVHVIFECLETVPHGYLTRYLQNEDGSIKTELTDDGYQPILVTEDIEQIEIRFKE